MDDIINKNPTRYQKRRRKGDIIEGGLFMSCNEKKNPTNIDKPFGMFVFLEVRKPEDDHKMQSIIIIPSHTIQSIEDVP